MSRLLGCVGCGALRNASVKYWIEHHEGDAIWHPKSNPEVWSVVENTASMLNKISLAEALGFERERTIDEVIVFLSSPLFENEVTKNTSILAENFDSQRRRSIIKNVFIGPNSPHRNWVER